MTYNFENGVKKGIYKPKICAICKKTFYISTGNKTRKRAGIRPKNSLTCKKECAKKKDRTRQRKKKCLKTTNKK